MVDDWTARAAAPGLDIEIRGGRGAEGASEYLVLALKGTPDLERAVAKLAPPLLLPWASLAPWAPWLEFWRAAWAPWLALLEPPRPDRRERP